jgi:hypothetical protein
MTLKEDFQTIKGHTDMLIYQYEGEISRIQRYLDYLKAIRRAVEAEEKHFLKLKKPVKVLPWWKKTTTKAKTGKTTSGMRKT